MRQSTIASWQARRVRLKFPVVTVVVAVCTAIVGLLQFWWPPLLGYAERSPAITDGQWWRLGTALFTQDGGWFGGISNIIALLILGTLAEQFLSIPRWLIVYFATGLITEFVGLWWQPIGAGNSIAVCGLAAALCIGIAIKDPRLPWWTSIAIIYWLAVLASTQWPPLAIPILIFAAITPALHNHKLNVVYPVVTIAAVLTAALCIAQNIHGAAMLIGTAIAPPTLLLRGGLLGEVR